MKPIHVGIIGANGYVGAELIRLLLQHPHVETIAIYSRSNEKEQLASIYPNFYTITNLTFVNEEVLFNESDVIFTSLPHGVSEEYALKCLSMNKRCIDLGADFRLDNEADYQEWYNLPYKYQELHKESVYGLSEIYHSAIKSAKIIGNPGCYPTAIALGLYPLLANQLYSSSHIIIDAKSGITGAGKNVSDTTHFANVYDGFHPYNVAKHRHTPEIRQTLSKFSGSDMHVTFVPHLLPINRGIIATMYVQVAKIQLDTLHQLYVDTYKNHPFVRVLDLHKTSDIKYVKYSNYCDISLFYDETNQTCIIVSAIDNMVKGAAGQAIQNMNIIYGFDETSGLTTIPYAF